MQYPRAFCVPDGSGHRIYGMILFSPVACLPAFVRGQNGELMLLLAYLLTRNDEWRGRPIRLLRVIENEAGRDEVTRHLTELAEQARIRVVPGAIVSTDVRRSIQETSGHAAVEVMGFEAPAEGDEAAFYERMEMWAGELPRVVFVDSIGSMSLDS
jgi:hypothetical protein